MGGLNMANINFQIQEFFERNIYTFLDVIPARYYKVSVFQSPESRTTFIYLIFNGGLLLQEERYSFAIDDFVLSKITKIDGTIDVKHLQYALDAILRMAKNKWRNSK